MTSSNGNIFRVSGHLFGENSPVTGDSPQRTCIQGQDRTEKRQQKGRKKEKHIYVNEDSTRFRAGPAKDARFLENTGNISDTRTMYSKILDKDNFGHVKVIPKLETK